MGVSGYVWWMGMWQSGCVCGGVSGFVGVGMCVNGWVGGGGSGSGSPPGT